MCSFTEGLWAGGEVQVGDALVFFRHLNDAILKNVEANHLILRRECLDEVQSNVPNTSDSHDGLGIQWDESRGGDD